MLQTSQVNYSVINHNISGAIHWIHCKDEAAQKVRDIFEKFEPGLSQPDVLQPIYSNLKNDLSLVAVASSENALNALTEFTELKSAKLERLQNEAQSLHNLLQQQIGQALSQRVENLKSRENA